MATIVNMDSTGKPAAQQAKQSVELIRQGMAGLMKLDGLRAEAIGAGQATMGAIFGITDNTEAQAFSDRWAALLAAFDDTDNTEFTKLRDFINAFNAT